MENVVLAAFDHLLDDIHATAVEKGWWGPDGDLERNFGEQIALMHSELSEALEFRRSGNSTPSDHIPEFLGIEEEFADVIVRIADTCKAYGYRLGPALIAKMAFNKTRPYKHGGKAF